MELFANLFNTTLTKQKLKKKNVTDKMKGEEVYFKVGVEVRKNLMEIGSIIPEDMPIEKIIKE